MAKKALNEMSFLDHLEELRWLLVRSTSAVIIMAIVTYFFSDFIFDTIIFYFDTIIFLFCKSMFQFACIKFLYYYRTRQMEKE
jgi:Sec-independent protein secretion pathway component TatC